MSLCKSCPQKSALIISNKTAWDITYRSEAVGGPDTIDKPTP